MALKLLTEKETAKSLEKDAAIVLTQTEMVGGTAKRVVRRIPFTNMASGLGADLDFDEDSQTLYLVNPNGERIGEGTSVQTGISGLQMYTETDDTGTQYLILADANNVELCRTEFTVTGTGSSTAYVCRLINGMSSIKLSFPSGQACDLNYEFYEYYGNEQTTVNATAEIYVKTATTDYVLARTDAITQGANSVSVTPYLKSGTNYVKLQVTGGESGTVKVLVFTINVVDITLTSSFDATQAYSSSISFMYRVTGRGIGKVMHFTIDGEPYDTVDIGTAHNVQLTETVNLAAYGHGDHVLRCWFVTSDGAISPTLTYDIIYDAAGVSPIISSTFDMEDVNYGELITVQYVVFTHGSDYTSEVDLDIYTIGEDGERSYYQRSALANVVNEALHSWNVTEYPAKGEIYLEITAGTAKKTFSLTVHENTGDRDLSGVSTRLIAAYTASGRSNSDVGKAELNAGYTSIDDITTIIKGKLTGFNWRSNGWVSDEDGYPVLRVSGGAEAAIDLPFFSSGWTDASGHRINLSGTPTGAGRTFEVAFATSGVTDERSPVMTVWDERSGVGIKVFPSRAYMLSSTMSVTEDADGSIINKNAIPYVPFSSTDGKVRLTFVIEEIGHYVETGDGNQNKQLIRVYVNGQLAKALAYTSDDFTSQNAKPRISAEHCILDIYSMRFYDYALSDSDVLKNYIADMPSIAERIEVYDKNAIVNDSDEINLDLARSQYPCMVLTGELSQYKGNKVKVGVLLYKPDGSAEEEYLTAWEFMDTDADGAYGNVNNVQGTSSQYYLKKNYKITFYRYNSELGKWVKVKVAIFEDRIPVSTICIKADYMSPDSANTGNANYWQTLLEEKTPPQEKDARVQTSVMGYPILVFQRNTAGETPTFIGRYNLNNDKSNSEAFGLEDDADEGNSTKCQKWEYLDNSEDICNFLTDRLRTLRKDKDGQYYEAWEDALESCYPDQGDLEDEGLRPRLSYIQMVYTWICQRANFIDASQEEGTGGSYNGQEYASEYELKRAIFRREFPKHFNLHHTLHYFIANEVPLLVDNLAKNLFMTTYDTTAEHVVDAGGTPVNLDDITANGAVNASVIDWENSTFCIWYPTLYDMDSCLGADNNGYDQFPYYKEMWDDYNNKIVVNGKNSLLWKLVYAAFYDELKALYCHMRDSTKLLGPTQYASAMIDRLTAALPIVAVNKDEQFKYIDAYEGGYLDYSTGKWLYTLSYLYLVKSTMESYHRDYIKKRFAMLDSKYFSDSYKQDCFNLRINRGQSEPDDLAFAVTPCQALYCATEWGNSGSYVGGKCLEGEQVIMRPASSGNWADIVLAVYGASHIKSMGDLSVLYPSKLQSLSLCKSLTELTLGSEREGYTNPYLDSIADVSYLTMLQRLNICNCTALSGTVDLSNCDLIEEVYAGGSGISSIVLPEGGYLKKLYLPGGVTALNIIDHAGMEAFGMDSYDALLRLRVENTPNIPTAAILEARGTALTRIRLIGIDWTLNREDALRALADESMASKAIDANGNNVNNSSTYPTVTGTVTIERIQGSLLDRLSALYPALTIRYTTKYHVVKFYIGDKLESRQEIEDGKAAVLPSTPLKPATVQYVHSFSGWDANSNIVTSDMTIHAQFSSSLQKYTIQFYEGDSETPGRMLAEVASVSYGGQYTYPEALPEKDGYVFCGWQDEDGNVYEYVTQMPDGSAKIDEHGVPLVISLYPVWSKIAMPTASKDFASLTHGERLFAAIAIQTGQADGCTVTYYSETSTYIIYETATNVSVTVAIGDKKLWVLQNGETITQEVADFNHDFSDLGETHRLGVTYVMENLLTDLRQMNAWYKHMFHYSVGGDDACISDKENHRSATDEALRHDHAVTQEEAEAGYTDILFLGQSYLSSIEVTHADGTKDAWMMDDRGYYLGEDTEAPEACTFYASDLSTPEGYAHCHKIGKMMQAASMTPTDGWGTAERQQARILDASFTFEQFGGLVFDATGDDTLNTAENNPFNGTGKARIAYHTDIKNDWNNFTEVSQGARIRVPASIGDVITVNCYGKSRNAGGWDETQLCAWANTTFTEQLPVGLMGTIVPACKKSSIGNRSYAIQKGMYRLWLLSNAEVNGQTGTHPYMDEGARYPIFTNDASRIKMRQDGAGDVSYWWERSPYVGYSYYFYYVGTAGNPHGNSNAGFALGVCLGFCSGQAQA